MKPLLETGEGLTILETIDRELGGVVGRVILVAPPDIAARLEGVVAREIVLDGGRGPALGLLEAAKVASTEWLLAVGGDQPRPTRRLLLRLLDHASGSVDAIAVVLDGHWQPLWALYRTRAVLASGDALGAMTSPPLHALLARLDAKEVFGDALDSAERASLLDADTPEDARALGLSRASPRALLP